MGNSQWDNIGELVLLISRSLRLWLGWLVGWLEFNVPFQHKYGYIRYDYGSVHITIHGPCLRAVNTGVQHGCHFGHPCSRLPVHTTHRHGP